MHNYPSDISREEFEIIRELLEAARKTTEPRKVDLYDVFCAVLYIVKGGIQWRMLPKDFPKWQTVYFYFQMRKKTDDSEFFILESALKKIVRSRPRTRVAIQQDKFLHH
jgi:transposase